MTRSIRWLRRLVPALLFLCDISLANPPAPSVEAVRHLRFGTMQRLQRVDVAFDSDSAALFRVIARKRSRIRLSVVAGAMQGDRGESMTIEIAPQDCAFSRDHGASWQRFESADLTHIVEIPDAGHGNGEIQVRVGASIVVGEAQQRGAYSGSVDILAEYVEPCDGESHDGVLARERRTPQTSPVVRNRELAPSQPKHDDAR